MELYQLGTNEVESGTYKWEPWTCPLLRQDVKSEPDGRAMNPEYYATDEAADILAQTVNGAVVDDPGEEGFTTNHKATAIKVGDHQVNAGKVLTIYCNDTAKANARAKSVEMSSMLGIPEDVTLADKLWTALGY